MSWNRYKCTIQGLSPLIMHNGDLANPRNQFAKMLKEHTAKRKKTETDLIEIERIEFLGGLYLNDGKVVIPSHVIEATIITAAGKTRERPLAKSGMYCTQDAFLIFHGPTAPAKLWENEQFHWREMVVVNRSRVPRMRPIFNEWKADLLLQYENTIINESQLKTWVEIAGKLVGIGERRPKYGRFEII